MRLLVFTQKVDSDDTTLGFFHGWLCEMSKKVDSISVICLERGTANLPKNVTVYSLGKERGISRLWLLWYLIEYLFIIRGQYDKVFVHMNQEYVVFGGLYWKLAGIPVYMWRNHPYGNIGTRIAVWLSTKVFCTSPQSFTAKYKKTVLMPVGVDTSVFHPVRGAVRKKFSICMVGRVAPIKGIDFALSAVHDIVASGGQVSLTIVGSPRERDFQYYLGLKRYVTENGLAQSVRFVEAVPQAKLPEIYSTHEICLNLTDSGSFDKTIVEAAACGAVPVVSNVSLSDFLPQECLTQRDPDAVSRSIQNILQPDVRLRIQSKLDEFVSSNSIDALMKSLFKEI